MSFRACWPITDASTPSLDLCPQACTALGRLPRQAHARPSGHGRFTAAPSAHVPGSGRVTNWVLIYECPARPTNRAPLRALPTNPAAPAHPPAGAAATPTTAPDTHQAGDTAA